MSKYELTDETKQVDGVTLHRIKALKDSANVKAGDYGGDKLSELMFRGQTRRRGEKIMAGEKLPSVWAVGYGVCAGDGDFSVIYTRHPVEKRVVYTETLGRYTGLTDRNGCPIYEGDIIRYNNNFGCDIYSVVKFGRFKCDGSSGEYGGTETIGFYAEMASFTRPDWMEDDDIRPNYYEQTISLLHWQVDRPEVIGNIWDNPELL